MPQISERREVRVRADAGTFVFAAEPEAGRLVIREERDEGAEEELCALTIADRDELSGFLQGLRRVLGVDEGEPRPSTAQGSSPVAGQRGLPREARSTLPGSSQQPAPSEKDGGGRGEHDGVDDRRDAMERARARGQGKAFAPWTRDEEQQLLEAVEAGRSLDELAPEHQRSRRALELRLERLRG